MLKERFANILKIAFAKIKAPTHFEFTLSGIRFCGEMSKVSLNLVRCEAKISGKLPHYCDRCGKDIILNLDERISLGFSDGLFKDGDELSNVIEFFDGEIDLEEVLKSELEAYKSDYFYCDECKNLEGE